MFVPIKSHFFCTQMLSCMNLDKYEGFPDEQALLQRSFDLLENNTYWAGTELHECCECDVHFDLMKKWYSNKKIIKLIKNDTDDTCILVLHLFCVKSFLKKVVSFKNIVPLCSDPSCLNMKDQLSGLLVNYKNFLLVTHHELWHLPKYFMD